MCIPSPVYYAEYVLGKTTHASVHQYAYDTRGSRYRAGIHSYARVEDAVAMCRGGRFVIKVRLTGLICVGSQETGSDKRLRETIVSERAKMVGVIGESMQDSFTFRDSEEARSFIDKGGD